MFCLPIHHDHHHHHRILHSFRSNKSLRAEAQAAPEMPHYRHQRHPSEASSVARSSTESSRPSTSRTDVSIEWDPLRLHPVGPVLVPVLDDIKRRELRQARSLHSLRQHQQETSHSHSHSEPAMVIYDGFDFGFASPNRAISHSAPTSPTTSEGATPRRHQATGDDYFKRGDWKRRGIVFGTSEATMATEDECFDLDVEM
ncbi:hypothetical protein B0T16DRAFT_451432 [Cercophora newfieldiana]|uniref:Uncharacterized protein n=1 Tax=Cercophora newfieldiana TaxID=92897 RepID=A0AA39YQ95_9PEZI|nr:hypothetical protein B0T16DRAFT_451432 [Cercophora newfieldiana]